MHPLTLGCGNKVWNVQYTRQTQEGFYLTSGEEDIAQNCKSLKINLNDEKESSGKHHLKEFDTFWVYTSQVGGKRFQYIITDSASEGDILEFAEKKPNKIKQRIYERYGLEGTVFIKCNF